MPLPYPTPGEVERFKALYEANFGVQLDSDQAQDLARRALQIFYLKTYGFKVLPARTGPPGTSRRTCPPTTGRPGTKPKRRRVIPAR